jgi:hypothetical protein
LRACAIAAGAATIYRNYFLPVDGHVGQTRARQVDCLRDLGTALGNDRDTLWTMTNGYALCTEKGVATVDRCSALPVAYSNLPAALWKSFAVLILEGAYEATLWAAVINAHRSPSKVLFLTQLGGGAFGNAPRWIHDAMRRALKKIAGVGLDVRFLSYRQPDRELERLAHEFV